MTRSGTCTLLSVASGTMPHMNWLVPLFALLGTMLQTYTSMKETGRAHRSVVDDWFAEDELVDAASRWRPIIRRRARRDIVAMRPPDVHRAIRHLNMVLLGWVLLDFAAAGALLGSLT